VSECQCGRSLKTDVCTFCVRKGKSDLQNLILKNNFKLVRVSHFAHMHCVQLHLSCRIGLMLQRKDYIKYSDINIFTPVFSVRIGICV